MDKMLEGQQDLQGIIKEILSMVHFKNLMNKIPIFDKIFLTFFIFLGLLYVWNTLSPSSYSLILDLIHTKNNGLILGTAQPARHDEYGLQTPLIQATINNHFNRYNKTSIYNEDLRMCFSLPIFDWGMIFKPTMWLYFFLNPAFAFSFYHYLLIFLFIYGYALFFRKFYLSHINALLVSLILFFTGAIQFWWTTAGSVFAIFPWIILALDLKINIFFKAIITYWICTCWLLSLFYPPFFIPYLFIALLIITGRKNAKQILTCLSFAMFGAICTSAVYLKDYLMLTQNTIYPGLRRISGGGISFERWLAQFFPILQSNNHQIFFRSNSILDEAIVGSFFIFFTICFLNYKNIFLRKNIANNRQITILLIGFILMSCWIFLPIPSMWGKIFLWDRVPTDRMLIPYGFLLLLITAIFAKHFTLTFSLKRFIFFSTSIILVFYHHKLNNINLNVLDIVLDMGIIPLVGLSILLTKKGILKINSYTLILVIFALLGMLIFGTYNPLQSSWAIFNRKTTDVTKFLDQIATENPDHILAIPDFQGAELNGLGYKSISHLQAVPQFKYWKKAFPNMTKNKFNLLFNRFALINLTYDDYFSLPLPHHLNIPIKIFNPSFRIKRLAQKKHFKILPSHKEGNIENIIQNENHTTVIGWAPWINISPFQALYIISPYKIKKTNIINIQRIDIATAYNDIRYMLCGFILKIYWDTNKKDPSFSLVAEDKSMGKMRLLNNHYKNAYWIK